MNPKFEKPFTLDRTVRLFIGIIITVFFFMLIKKLSGVILPFLISCLFAYMIYPLVKFFQYKLRLKFRSAAIFLALVTIFGSVFLAAWALKPLINHEFAEINLMIGGFINNTANFGTLIPPEWVDEIRSMLASIDIRNILTKNAFMQIVEKVSPQLWRLITSSFNLLISMFIIFIVLLYIFFILLDYETLEKQWVKLVPEKYRHFASQLASDLQNGMNRYFRSQALIAFSVGILFAAGFKIINFPLGISLGLFMGILNLVPYLQTIGLFPIIILAVIKAGSMNENFFMIFLSAIAVLAIVQVIQDMILVPKIMGHTTGLRPAVILLSLSVWGSLLGMTGLIIALPITMVLISYYKRFVLNEPVAEETGERERIRWRKKTGKLIGQ